MAHQLYQDRKPDYDKKVMMYLVKRLLDDRQTVDAVKHGVTDDVGNVIDGSDKNKWAHTQLDKLVGVIQNSIGRQKLAKMLSDFEFVKDIDPLTIMEWDGKADLPKHRDALKKIVVLVEDGDFVPDDFGRKISDQYEGEDKDEPMSLRISKSLTLLTFLLYGLKDDKTPTEADFDYNILPSVEATFGHQAHTKYGDIKKICDERNYFDFKKLSKNALILLGKCAKIMETGGILRSDVSRVENQTKNWRRIARL